MIDFFVKIYGSLHNYQALPYWVLTPFRRMVRSSANLILPRYLSKTHYSEQKKYTDIIVSFTSFPARISEVWQVVECMKRQSYRPSKIILWLSKKQFIDIDKIPLSLRKLEDDIFTINFVDEDIRSHKKYYYVAKKYPKSLILLIDDDIYYPTDMIECLYNAYLKYSQSVICQYGYFMKYDEAGRLLPYRLWKHVNKESINDSSLFFGSGGGTLFNPSLLYQDLLKKDLFLELSPKADDIWLNAMVKLANLSIYMLKPRLILPIKSKEEKVTLCSENIGGGGNDIQLKKVIHYYVNQLGINPFEKR